PVARCSFLRRRILLRATDGVKMSVGSLPGWIDLYPLIAALKFDLKALEKVSLAQQGGDAFRRGECHQQFDCCAHPNDLRPWTDRAMIHCQIWAASSHQIEDKAKSELTDGYFKQTR